MNVVEWLDNLVEWLDRGAANVVAPLHRGWLDALMIGATHLGDGLTLAAVVLVALVVLRLRRQWRPAAVLGATFVAAFVLSESVKEVVARPRPDVPWRTIALPTTPSFPSSHALESMAVYGALALTVCQRLRRRRVRVLAVALGVALSLLIGFSRVYNGVHYLTDVLGGWVGGLALVLLAAWVGRRWPRRTAARESRDTGPPP